jgi:hypothetical protein
LDHAYPAGNDPESQTAQLQAFLNYLDTKTMIERAYLYQWYESAQPAGAPTTANCINDTSLTDPHEAGTLQRCQVRLAYWAFKTVVAPPTADPEPSVPWTWPC